MGYRNLTFYYFISTCILNLNSTLIITVDPATGRLKKINATGVASVEPGKENEVCQMKFPQMKLQKVLAKKKSFTQKRKKGSFAKT